MKNQFPVNLTKADDTVKSIVCLGALRNYVKHFYKDGINILIDMYGINKGEEGHRFACNHIFENFVGKENAGKFKNLKVAKYRYFDFRTLALYCNYLQGLFVHLTAYKKINPNANVYSFQKLVNTYGYYTRHSQIRTNIKVCENFASDSLNNKVINAYQNYYLIDKNVVQQEFDNYMNNQFYVNANDMQMPFVLDLEYLNNNKFFDKRKDSFINSDYKAEILSGLIDFCCYIEDKNLYENYNKFFNEAVNEILNVQDKRKDDEIKRRFDEKYVIPDETM